MIRRVAALCLLFGAQVRAQDPDGLMIPVGTRVRVVAGGLPAHLIGRVVHVDERRVEIAVSSTGSTVSIPRRDLLKLEWSLGIDRSPGMRGGTFVGIGTGVYLTADFLYSLRGCEGYCSPGIGLLIPVVIAFNLTVPPLLGAMAGAQFASEQWHPTPHVLPDSANAEETGIRVLLRPGDPIRLRTIAGLRQHGRIAESEFDGISIVTKSDTTSVRWASVSQLELRGERHRAKGALWGAAALTGATLAYYRMRPGPWRGEVLTMSVVAASAGSSLGQALGPRRWIPLPVPTR